MRPMIFTALLTAATAAAAQPAQQQVQQFQQQQQQQLQPQQQQQQYRPVPQAPSATYLAGRQARLDGRLDTAETLLRRALAATPNDYLTLYNLGLVFEARSRQTSRGPARIALLQTAAAWLERALANLGSDYTIFNTLGYVYIQLGDLSTAEARFEAGLRYADRLSPVSRGKLLSNLGYIRALRGDTAGAVKLLERGAATGNANAIDNLSRLKSAK